MRESSNRIAATRFPQGNLALAHLGEARGGEPVVLAQPDSPAVLGSRVAGGLVDRLLLTDVPHSDLLVPRRRDEEATARVP